MKLTKEDIMNIDKWLKWIGIKYVDIRYELIDHLVTEYEQIENYPDLKSFLIERRLWCKKVAKEKQKAVNFGTTKALFRKLIELFVNPKSLGIIILAGLLLFGFQALVPLKIFRYTLLALLIISIVYEMYLMIFSGFGNILKKESVSVMYLVNIFVLPQMPLYWFGLIPKNWLEDPYFFIPFLTIGTLLNIAAILVFHEKRRILLKEFKLLKSSLP